MKPVAIVIPYFRSKPEWFEEVSVKQVIRVLGNFDHVLVCPEGLDTTVISTWYASADKQVAIRNYPKFYFKDPLHYNKLMLSAFFYEDFVDYKYILIHQTDVYVFRDELMYWVKKEYDYIGAPWVDWIHASYQVKNKSLWARLQWCLGRRRFDAVGNGGFSLRKVESLASVLNTFQIETKSYAKNEDFFFSFEANKHEVLLKIPSVREALNFSFDENPEDSYLLNKKQLPMACHAWPKYFAFWNQFIRVE